MSSKLPFGSDGYRGIIGSTFTWSEVSRLAMGTCAFLEKQAVPSASPIPIGYDTRFLAREFALGVGKVFAEKGFNPLISETPCPSPYISFCVKELSAPIGVVITASHNPFYYLGFKLKGPEGGSATPAVQKEISKLSEEMEPISEDFEVLRSGESPCKTLNLVDSYSKELRKLVNLEGLPNETELTVDFMNGACVQVYSAVLRRLSVDFSSLRTTADPLFGGRKPEPIEAELGELVAWIEAGEGHGIGAAFDGDGDRLALVDESGEIVPSHEIFGIILLHLAEDRKLKGRVVKTVSYSSLLNRLAESFGLEVKEIPVGFKYATEELMKRETLIAGEESGGIGFGFYLPERDALLVLLLILEAMRSRRKRLCSLREELWGRFGRSYFNHEDIELPGETVREKLKQALELLKNEPTRLGIDYEEVSYLDGVKFSWKTGFLLLRPSGTEPLLRIYCDEMSQERMLEVREQARSFVHTFLG